VVEEQNEKTAQLCFTIKDTGIGIAPGKIHTVFERFMQADSNTTRKFGGTQTLAVRMLKKLGYDPGLSENGILALEETQRIAYDIILMDIQMPEMDGLEATRLIRKGNTKQPIIVAMTANVLPEDREACFNAGMDDYISKPIPVAALAKCLEKWALFLQNKKRQLP
jgi:CheY-like chemotaxis protein